MKRFLTTLLLLLFAVQTYGQSREQAQQKMEELRGVIATAKKKKINTLKEETALRSAEIFMDYADWDEQNYETVKGYFSIAGVFRKEADKYATILPEFQRTEIVKMMDSSIAELTDVISGKRYRLESPQVDWSKVEVQGDCISYNDKPVFLADWTWKPKTKRFTEYHGNQSIAMISPTLVQKNGKVSDRVLSELEEKIGNTAGFIFMNHASMPAWAKSQDPTLMEGIGEKYVMYDINNPLGREVYADLLKSTIPAVAGKSITKLGYMLCNEPHWNSIEGTYAANPISPRAVEDFKVWLQQKHGSIEVLNKRWGTSFESFDKVESAQMMKKEDRGTAYFFDFMSYNMDRVSDWFAFLKSELLKYDPEAKSHIKIMPNYWTTNSIDHGLDIEVLTRNSDIIGNDASSCGKYLSGDSGLPWEDGYEFDWIETCMGYDFMKSVSPDKIVFNTEGHHLSTGRYRNLYQTKEYVRCNYWMSTIHGQSAIQTWFWARDEKGAYCRSGKVSTGYGASNNHQPRVVNEVHATMIDMNSMSDVMMTIQRERKSIRIFYTKASAINKNDHMTDTYYLYEKLNFEGMPIGFATQGIIDYNDNDEWDVIAIYKTPMVFEEDVVALQKYLDQGGVIVMDSESLLTNEYGETLKNSLTQSKGKIITASSLTDVASNSLSIATQKAHNPRVIATETNDRGKKGVLWRVVEQKADKTYVVNLLNLGNSDAIVDLSAVSGAKIKKVSNYLDGVEHSTTKFVMKPNDVLVLKLEI